MAGGGDKRCATPIRAIPQHAAGARGNAPQRESPDTPHPTLSAVFLRE
jgi:hypothetical protein